MDEAQELQGLIDMVSGNDLDVSEVLRKAKSLISSFQSSEPLESAGTELLGWIELELSGYPESSPLPEYRQAQIEVGGEYKAPNGGPVQTMLIPTEDLPEQFRESAKTLPVSDGAQALEARCDSGSETLWLEDWLQLFQASSAERRDLILTGVYQEASGPVYQKVLNSVRSEIHTR